MALFIFLSVVLSYILNLENAFAFDFNELAQFAESQAATQVLMKDMGLGKKSDVQILQEQVTAEGDIDYVAVTLKRDSFGTIRLMLKGPHGFYTATDHSYRTLFVASGLFSGRDSVKVVNSLDKIIIVGYEYPYSAEQIGHNPQLAYEFMRLTSPQIAASLQWMSERPFQRRQELYSIGVSLGGLFLPSALHIAQTIGVQVRGSVFAFTGADLVPVVEKGVKEQLRPDAIPMAVAAVKGISLLHNPALHLPYLRGEFLTIRGSQDQVFPAESSIKIEQLLPEPKRIEVVEGGHINTDQTALIEKTQDLIRDWLGL